MNILTHWSIVPILLKPDALEGDETGMWGLVAADYAAYLAGAVDSLSVPDYEPFVAASRVGAETARKDAQFGARTYPWWVMPLQDVEGCQGRLWALHREWARRETIEAIEVVERVSVALGFEIIVAETRVLTLDEYMLLYGATKKPEIHVRMQPYMVGKPVRLLLLCGQQENSALQLMKTYLRSVVRYPLEEVTYRNWIHITDPDDVNYPGLLAMYFSGREALGASPGTSLGVSLAGGAALTAGVDR